MITRKRFLATCVSLLVSAGVAFAQPENEAIPDRFVFRRSTDAIWTSESAALASDGRIHPGVVSSEWRKERVWRRGAQARGRGAAPAPDACTVEFFGLTDDHDGFTVATLAELQAVASTRSLYTGVVTASRVGWHAGMPFTVLRIASDAHRVVYLLYPFGRLRLDDMIVCNADPEYADMPRAGDRIAFVASRPIDSTEALFATSGSWILYERAGKVVTSPDLRDDAALQTFATLRVITEYLRQEFKR